MSSRAVEAASAEPPKVKLLVVDDDFRNIVDLRAVLESPDRELVVAASGSEAVGKLAEHDFALILLSLELPGAVETAAHIDALDAAWPVPVIFVTSVEQNRAHATRAYESGAVDVISRPADPTMMRAKVSVFVDLYRARQQLHGLELRARGEAERLASSLVQAEQLQQQFLATLGKELRPPLNAIVGWVRMLREGSIREAQRVRALETVERNAVAQLALIEEMLDISRMTSGQLALELGTVDLAQVTENVVESMRPGAVAKLVTLFAAVERDIAPMSGDLDRLRQIVHQLVSNAVSCTPTEGVVTVSLRNIGAEVELAITDTGPGMETELATSMFAPFPGSVAVTSRAVLGLGAGLAIVRHLVELHDGSIRVESAGAGHGCRFVVLLPVAGRKPRTDDEMR